MGIVDDSLKKLIRSKELSPSDIYECLECVRANISVEGVSVTLIDEVIGYLCETTAISTSTKILLIREALLPNGPVPSSTVYTVLKQLGVKTLSMPLKREVARDIQVELCKWLVHVYIFMEDISIYEKTYSMWFQLWQYDFLQTWITYLLFWSTNRRLAKDWRVSYILRVSSKNGYTNCKALATLLLQKFKLVMQNEKAEEAIKKIQCNNGRLKTLKHDFWAPRFLENWSSVLETCGCMSKVAFFDLVKDLTTQLSFEAAEIDQKVDTQDIVTLNSTVNIETLAENIESFKVSKDIERLLTTRDRTIFVFLATLDQADPFWSDLEEWCTIRLKLLLFRGRENTEKEKLVTRAILTACLLVPKDLNTLVAISDKVEELQLADWYPLSDPYCSAVFILTGNTSEDSALERIVNARQNFKGKKFYAFCQNLLSEIYFSCDMPNCHERAGAYSKTIKYILTLLHEDVLRLLPDRHITLTFRLVVKLLSRLGDQGVFDALLSSSYPSKHVLNILMASSDPIALSSLADFLIVSQKIVMATGKDKRLVRLHNHCVLDLSNYLWRNKMNSTGTLFGVPTLFFRNVINGLNQFNSEFKSKSWLTLLSIPAFSFYSMKAVKSFEEASSSKVSFKGPLTEINFDTLRRTTKTSDWLDTIATFQELKNAILAHMKYHGAYKEIPEFLFSYVRSLTDVFDD